MLGLPTGFRGNEVRKTIRRITGWWQGGDSSRASSRSDRRDGNREILLMPMLFTQVLETEDDLIDHLGPAVSQGFSNEGFSMLAYGELQSEEILTVITDPHEVALLHCRVRHARAIGYGYFLRGIQVQEKLRWEPFARLRTAVDDYNKTFQVAAPITAVA